MSNTLYTHSSNPPRIAPPSKRKPIVVIGWAEGMDRWNDGTGTFHAIREAVYGGNNDPQIDGKEVSQPVCGANLHSWGGLQWGQGVTKNRCCHACVRMLMSHSQSYDIPRHCLLALSASRQKPH